MPSWLNKEKCKLDIVFVETNTRCSAIVGSVFESIKKVLLLIARQSSKKSNENVFSMCDMVSINVYISTYSL